jgi:hypothetical protein
MILLKQCQYVSVTDRTMALCDVCVADSTIATQLRTRVCRAVK